MYNLNEYERQRRIAESTKKLYSPGTRIELISMKDPYAPVPAGTRGTVKFVDSMGTIFPEWDNGRSLGVVPSEDSFRKLTQEEIEKYAKQAYEAIYDTGGELYFDDARKIVPEQLPDFDLLFGGFPCQSFSITGARKGFDDIRGTLFFKIARIAAVKKPKYLFIENVPGLLNHDSGKTFETILRTRSPKSCKLFGERRHSIADELLTACGRNE